MNSNRKTARILEDVKIDVRIKLAATWIAAMFGYIYGDILGFYIPGHIGKIMAGELPIGSQVSVLAAAILMSIPGFMVFLSLTLKAKANRWVNIIMGIIHIVIMLGSFFIPPVTFNLFYIYLAIVEIGFNTLTIWYALKWPKQEA